MPRAVAGAIALGHARQHRVHEFSPSGRRAPAGRSRPFKRRFRGGPGRGLARCRAPPRHGAPVPPTARLLVGTRDHVALVDPAPYGGLRLGGSERGLARCRAKPRPCRTGGLLQAAPWGCTCRGRRLGGSQRGLARRPAKPRPRIAGALLWVALQGRTCRAGAAAATAGGAGPGGASAVAAPAGGAGHASTGAAAAPSEGLLGARRNHDQTPASHGNLRLSPPLVLTSGRLSVDEHARASASAAPIEGLCDAWRHHDRQAPVLASWPVLSSGPAPVTKLAMSGDLVSAGRRGPQQPAGRPRKSNCSTWSSQAMRRPFASRAAEAARKASRASSGGPQTKSSTLLAPWATTSAPAART